MSVPAVLSHVLIASAVPSSRDFGVPQLAHPGAWFPVVHRASATFEAPDCSSSYPWRFREFQSELCAKTDSKGERCLHIYCVLVGPFSRTPYLFIHPPISLCSIPSLSMHSRPRAATHLHIVIPTTDDPLTPNPSPAPNDATAGGILLRGTRSPWGQAEAASRDRSPEVAMTGACPRYDKEIGRAHV